MIGLVFGFFVAIILVIICLGIVGVLLDSGAIWWILGAAVLLIIWATSVSNRPPSQLSVCLDKVQTASWRITSPDLSTRYVSAASQVCHDKYDTR